MPNAEIWHSIDDFIDLKRSHHFNPGVHVPAPKVTNTTPTMQTWLLTTLRADFKMSPNQLSRAARELYQGQIAIVTSFKPVVGEQELRQSKQASTVQYFRVKGDSVCEFGSTNLLEAYP